MSNKRRLERFELAIPATLILEEQTGDEDGQAFDLVTTDISAGGAFFQTDQPLPEGISVRIELVLDTEKLKKMTGKYAYLRVKGRVVRSSDQGMAISFEPRYEIKTNGKLDTSHDQE